MQSRDARCFSSLKCDACGQTDRIKLTDAYRHVPFITPLINVSLLYRYARSTYLCYSYGALSGYVTPNKYRKTASMKALIKKVKCTLVQALRLCTGRTAHRGSRGIALLFHDHGTRRG